MPKIILMFYVSSFVSPCSVLSNNGLQRLPRFNNLSKIEILYVIHVYKGDWSNKCIMYSSLITGIFRNSLTYYSKINSSFRKFLK